MKNHKKEKKLTFEVKMRNGISNQCINLEPEFFDSIDELIDRIIIKIGIRRFFIHSIRPVNNKAKALEKKLWEKYENNPSKYKVKKVDSNS